LSVENSFKTSKTLFHNINLVNIRKLKILRDTLYGISNELDFTDIINSCSRLIFLDIDHFINENLLIKMTRLCQLEVLRMQSKTDKSSPSKILQILAEQCRNLKVVNLHFCSEEDYCFVDKDKFQTKFRYNLSNFIKQNKFIHKFTLNMINVTFTYDFSENNEPMVDSWGLIDIINQNSHNIEECELTYSGTMNVSYIANFINNNDQLKSFILTNNSYRNDYDPEIIYRYENASNKSIYCYDFEDPYSVNMNHIGDSNLAHLFSSVENFTDIKLTNIGELSNDFIILISLKNFSTLISFRIEGYGYEWSLSAISLLFLNCKLLKQLSLIGCSHISDAEFNELCLTPNNLSHLVIKDAWHLTTITLVKIISHCKYLKICEYDDCPLLDHVLVDEFCIKTLRD
jgi:hypothetical protein